MFGQTLIYSTLCGDPLFSYDTNAGTLFLVSDNVAILVDRGIDLFLVLKCDEQKIARISPVSPDNKNQDSNLP